MPEMSLARVEVTVGDAHEDASMVAEFLFLFRAVYAAAIESKPSDRPLDSLSVEEVGSVGAYLRQLSVSEIDGLFTRDLGRNTLQVESLTHRSPLVFVFVGVGVCILSAIFLSGGKFRVSLTGVAVELNPVGDGISKLADAIANMRRALGGGIPFGYGSRAKRLVLSPDEFEELQRAANGRGGFQTFLRQLRRRVNPATRELELSPSDIERIYRYATAGKGGGFQDRLRRIFGSHLQM